MTLTPGELDELRLARQLLEVPGLAAKVSDAVGAPIEKSLQMLPKKWNTAVVDITRKSIEKALDVAVWSLGSARQPPANSWHRIAAGTVGAAGGAFGLAALAVELPLSTTIMLRSIADIARGEGEDIEAPEARIECVQVLALGGKSAADDGAETGYFAARAAMASAVSDAIRHVAQKGASQSGAPAIVRLIAAVASRFSVNVTEKAAAQAIPLIGALGGAVINTLFIGHFQDMARGHFIVRRLERRYGTDVVSRAYGELT